MTTYLSMGAKQYNYRNNDGMTTSLLVLPRPNFVPTSVAISVTANLMRAGQFGGHRDYLLGLGWGPRQSNEGLRRSNFVTA